jgi:hypothetical protein
MSWTPFFRVIPRARPTRQPPAHAINEVAEMKNEAEAVLLRSIFIVENPGHPKMGPTITVRPHRRPDFALSSRTCFISRAIFSQRAYCSCFLRSGSFFPNIQ